ncbi:MAG: ATP-binding cassette domain-containing protein [Deltaproteobacteria bacterium]|jgi:molybdate transport system ATP-binding protein|nr:ATP-binding cassette domain-containing protein [Deltaproteobacteria bacterium]
MTAYPLVRLDNVNLRLGRSPVFSGLSLDIQSKEHLAVLGPNGAGKSSLLRLLAGELRPDQDSPGKIFWAFTDAPDPSPLTARKHARLVSPLAQRNYVRQGWKISGLEILLSGLDNTALLYGETSEKGREEALRLAKSAGAELLLKMKAPAMSQGQLRLALLLRALLSRPDLLLLDEPFDGLDKSAREACLSALGQAADRGCTLVLAGHRKEDLPPLIRRTIRLEMWKNRPAPPGQPEKARKIPAASCPDLRPEKAEQTPVLELLDVDVYIERAKILSGITWTIRPGEQWLVSGPNGSGKSTLLRLLCGEEFAAFKEGAGGILRWFGAPRPDLLSLRRLVGYVSPRLQDGYDPESTAEEVVVSGLRGSIGLYGGAPTAEERAVAWAWMERMGLLAMRGLPFAQLSSGWGRRFLLARALAGSPPVLLLDEPCSGLDAASRDLFLKSLAVLAARGVQIIHVSHQSEDIAPFFSHELRLEGGRVAFAGPRA